MKISEITNQKAWQDCFDKSGSMSFLQSWEWGEFEKSIGYDILRLGLFEKDELVGIAQIIKIKAKRGSFLFIPHGPLLIKNEKLKINNLLDYLVEVAGKEGFSFIRISPILNNNQENKDIYKKLGFINAPIYMHAENIWALSLEKSENELLNDMRKTTRYSIGKATRDKVIIEKRTDSKSVDEFYLIYKETATREQFVPFSKSYIKKEFMAFNKTDNALFIFAKLGSKCLASALIIFTKSTAFYHQGASIHTKIPTTYLLQWEAIKEAKKRRCQFYNFWGIAPANQPKHPWNGLTLFKQGFGGYEINYLETKDYILSPKYYLTYVYEKLLRWKRRA